MTHKIPLGVGGGWLQNRVCFAIRRLHDLIKLRTQSFMDIKWKWRPGKARDNSDKMLEYKKQNDTMALHNFQGVRRYKNVLLFVI